MPQSAVPESYRAEVVPATALADEPRPLLLDPDPAAGHEVGGAELDDADVVVRTASDSVDDLEAAPGRVAGQAERGGPGRRMPRYEQPFSAGVADRREARPHPDFGRLRPWVLVYVLSRCAPVVQCSSSTGSPSSSSMEAAVLRWNSVPNAPAIPAAAPLIAAPASSAAAAARGWSGVPSPSMSTGRNTSAVRSKVSAPNRSAALAPSDAAASTLSRASAAAWPQRLASFAWWPDSMPSRPRKSRTLVATWLLDLTAAGESIGLSSTFELALRAVSSIWVRSRAVLRPMSSRRFCHAVVRPRRWLSSSSGEASSTRSSSSTETPSWSWKVRARTASHSRTLGSASLVALAISPRLAFFSSSSAMASSWRSAYA